jgi:hypothetical protein
VSLLYLYDFGNCGRLCSARLVNLIASNVMSSSYTHNYDSEASIVNFRIPEVDSAASLAYSSTRAASACD